MGCSLTRRDTGAEPSSCQTQRRGSRVVGKGNADACGHDAAVTVVTVAAAAAAAVMTAAVMTAAVTDLEQVLDLLHVDLTSRHGTKSKDGVK